MRDAANEWCELAAGMCECLLTKYCNFQDIRTPPTLLASNRKGLTRRSG
jgi:hypothetical protein